MQDQGAVRRAIEDGMFPDLKQVRITFNVLFTAVKKQEYMFPPTAKLLEVKVRLDSDTTKKFNFYLRESFMPSLGSRVGDIALCYGTK